jgi:hypothetical protein
MTPRIAFLIGIGIEAATHVTGADFTSLSGFPPPAPAIFRAFPAPRATGVPVDSLHQGS